MVSSLVLFRCLNGGLLAGALCLLVIPHTLLAQSKQGTLNKSIRSETITWLSGSTVSLQTLDKVTDRIGTLPIKIGSTVRFGTLEITAHHCAYRPPEEPPEHSAFLSIEDVGYDNKTAPQSVFSGWMFASSPAVSSLEHAVYDVTVLACAK